MIDFPPCCPSVIGSYNRVWDREAKYQSSEVACIRGCVLASAASGLKPTCGPCCHSSSVIPFPLHSTNIICHNFNDQLMVLARSSQIASTIGREFLSEIRFIFFIFHPFIFFVRRFTLNFSFLRLSLQIEELISSFRWWDLLHFCSLWQSAGFHRTKILSRNILVSLCRLSPCHRFLSIKRKTAETMPRKHVTRQTLIAIFISVYLGLDYRLGFSSERLFQ